MSIKIIINNYSKSAFNIAKQNNIVTDFLSDLTNITQTISSLHSKELLNPTISKKSLKDIMEVIGVKLSLRTEVINFIKIIAKNRRIQLLPKILQNFQKLVKKDQNIISVQIFSINQITEHDINEIKKIVTKMHPNKQIEIEQIIKKEIFGGVMIKIDSQLIDASLKNTLAQLESQLQSTIN